MRLLNFWLPLTCAVTLILLVIFMPFPKPGEEKPAQWRVDCSARGGVPVSTRYEKLCLAKEIFR